MLYDFYGVLLTEHQKSIYEDVVINDLSYSEIANLNGISRQGVYDLIKRCDKILEDYESRLRLVERFETAREKIAGMRDTIAELKKEENSAEYESLLARMDAMMVDLLEQF